MNKFKIGDKVKLIRKCCNAKAEMVGVIKGRMYDYWAVEFDKKFSGGHECEGICDKGKGHFIYSEDLILINETWKERLSR